MLDPILLLELNRQTRRLIKKIESRESRIVSDEEKKRIKAKIRRKMEKEVT